MYEYSYKTRNSHITCELSSGFATKWIQVKLGLARNELQNKTKQKTKHHQLSAFRSFQKIWVLQLTLGPF